jgi:hypothetical protein
VLYALAVDVGLADDAFEKASVRPRRETMHRHTAASRELLAGAAAS